MWQCSETSKFTFSYYKIDLKKLTIAITAKQIVLPSNQGVSSLFWAS